MSYRTIRSAQQAVWPAVKDSIARHAASRRAVKEDPAVATVAARNRARKPWDRVVAEETVWAIAKADLLATPEQAAVIEAAREWARSWPTDLDLDDEEVALYTAVQALATSFTPQDKEEVA